MWQEHMKGASRQLFWKHQRNWSSYCNCSTSGSSCPSSFHCYNRFSNTKSNFDRPQYRIASPQKTIIGCSTRTTNRSKVRKSKGK
jgi:hypothetical protein